MRNNFNRPDKNGFITILSSPDSSENTLKKNFYTCNSTIQKSQTSLQHQNHLA